MTDDKDGGPAFPCMVKYEQFRGMSMWDWYAGQALMGICADSNMDATPDMMAQGSANIADAMMAERKKREANDGGR